MKKNIALICAAASISLGLSQSAVAQSAMADSLPFIGNQSLQSVESFGYPLISNNGLALVTNRPALGLASKGIPLISNGPSQLFGGAGDPLITNELPIMSNAGSAMIENVDSGLPMLSNAGGYSAPAGFAASENAPAATSASARRRIEQLATGAAAAALVELKCNPSGFEQSSRDIQRLFEAKAMVVGNGDPKAKTLAKAAGKARFLALAKSNRGQGCESVSGLRALAAIDGFDRE